LFNIHSHKGNANQSDSEIPSYLTHNGNHQENNKYVSMKGGKEAVYTGGGNVISSATMEISMRFLKN
jgi:hypothetical protein